MHSTAESSIQPSSSSSSVERSYAATHRFKGVLERSFRQHLQTCQRCTDDQLCEAGTKLFQTWAAA